MKIAFFDVKPYDKPGFDARIAGTGLEIKYFETKLSEDTVRLARGFDGVCVFVNDTVNALHEMGVRVLALRCAGFNNVDIRACAGKLRVFRVPAYSPYAVAEHAMALLRPSTATPTRHISAPGTSISVSPVSPASISTERPPVSSAPARSGAFLRTSARASVCTFWPTTNIPRRTAA